MLIKRKFPTTSIAGRFFNDFLKGRDLIALYTPLIIKASRDSNTTTFFLKEIEGTLSIQYFDGYILWVRCETAAPTVIAELNAFATKHMKPLRDEGEYRTYLYKQKWIFSICAFDVNEPCTHSYQLFTDRERPIWPGCTSFKIFRYRVVNFVRNASRRIIMRDLRVFCGAFQGRPEVCNSLYTSGLNGYCGTCGSFLLEK